MSIPLVILDRDGVINHDSDDYIKSPDEWQAIPGSLTAIAALHQAGCLVAVATNQAGIARGLFTIDVLEAIHAKLTREVEAVGGRIAGIYYCPHHPEDACDCRKPKTGLLDQIERDLGVAVAGAPFIGDSMKDLQAAISAGCRPILVRTGKGEQTVSALGGETEEIYDDLAEAVLTIKKELLNQ